MAILRLCFCGGRLWYGHDRLAWAAAPPDEPLPLPFDWDEIEAVRTVGSLENAALIARLDDFRAESGAAFGIEAASPLLAAGSPRTAMQRLWQLPAAGRSSGSWRAIGRAGAASYRLAARAAEAFGGGAPVPAAAWEEQPFWRAWSFLPRLDPEALAEYVLRIVDPCWFVHEGRPGRLGAVFARLCLRDPTQFSAGQPDPCCPLEPPPAYVEDDPACWPWRVARSGGDPEFRAARAVTRYLHLHWLAALGGPAFAPELFFRERGEIAAYERHLAKPARSAAGSFAAAAESA